MNFTAKQLAILRQFNVVDAQDRWIQRKLIFPEDHPLGYGPKVHPDVINKLFTLDTTQDQIWLSWILHQAAGGDRARESSMRAMEQMQQRFLDERLHGYQHAKSREVFPAMDKTEAERRWTKIKDRMSEVLVSADQDSVSKLGVWGFFREWPGNQGIYQKVFEVFTAWNQLQPQVAQMNRELERESKETMATTPEAIRDIEVMEGQCKKVVRYFASKQARDDIRLASWHGNDWIYNDDTLLVVCPLTYAASVRYGSDAWPFASREAFERLLLDENNFSDNWGSQAGSGLFWVFFHFKVPVPRWVSRKNGQFVVYELTNLALTLSSKSNGTWSFTDEEGMSRTKEQVCDMLRGEALRAPEPQDTEMPIKRGPNVYTKVEEAEAVIRRFEQALTVVAEWARGFDTKRIKVKPLDYATKPTAELPAESPS